MPKLEYLTYLFNYAGLCGFGKHETINQIEYNTSKFVLITACCALDFKGKLNFKPCVRSGTFQYLAHYNFLD